MYNFKPIVPKDVYFDKVYHKPGYGVDAPCWKAGRALDQIPKSQTEWHILDYYPEIKQLGPLADFKSDVFFGKVYHKPGYGIDAPCWNNGIVGPPRLF